MPRTIVRKAATGEPGNPGQFGHRRRAEAAMNLRENTLFQVGDDGWYATHLDVVNGEGVTLGRLKHHIVDPPGYIEVVVIDVDSRYRGQGFARSLMAELERTHPGVPISHGALTKDGLAFNIAIYGPETTGDELTLIDPNDDDAHEYEHVGISDGEILYRGGWTLDGVRIPPPH